MCGLFKNVNIIILDDIVIGMIDDDKVLCVSLRGILFGKIFLFGMFNVEIVVEFDYKVILD